MPRQQRLGYTVRN